MVLFLLTFCASTVVGIPGVVGDALADSSVVPPRAVGIVRAGARVDALLPSAGQGVDAVLVHQTLVRPTVGVGVGIRKVVFVTATVGSVVGGLAVGIGAALLKQAGVLTVSLDAGLVVPTLKVRLAAS